MSDLSLTEFVDIATVTTDRKVAKIRNAKNKEPYNPAFDFYKRLRDGIVSAHKSSDNKRALNKILTNQTDKKKITNYPNVIAGYKKFWGSKKISWIEPPKEQMVSHNISVSVNPEIGISFNNKNYIVKLYFKREKLAKARVNMILQLMEETLRSSVPDDYVFSVLDIRRAKLIEPTVEIKDASIVLDAEMSLIASVWDKV
ncbi:MAG: hypothetical protein AAF465_10050 [Pseudomonadota bacterium]